MIIGETPLMLRKGDCPNSGAERPPEFKQAMFTPKGCRFLGELELSNTLLSIGAPGVPGSAIACSVAMKQTVKLDGVGKK